MIDEPVRVKVGCAGVVGTRTKSVRASVPELDAVPSGLPPESVAVAETEIDFDPLVLCEMV